MLEEPCVSVNRISVAFNNVSHWIKLDNPLVIVRNNINIPKYRSQPLKQLQSDIYDLQKISEKYNNSAGRIADGKHQYKLASQIVNKLEPVQIRVIPIDTCDDKKHKNKEYMDKHRSNYLDDR